MGQRHQVFIKTHNPNYGDNKGIIGGWVDGKFKDDPRTKKAFGGRKYTIFAYHHQWLFGRCAAFIAHKLMTLALSFKDDDSTEMEYNHPLSPKFNRFCSTTLDRVGDYFQYFMGIITPGEKFPRGIGLESFIFLNPDEPIMRERFDCGDNNDGITIVDMIEKKYCLMNIYEYEEDVECACGLPSKVPVSAADYARAYYPTTEDTLSHYTKEDLTSKEIQEKLRENQKHVAEIEKMFKGMEVLSLKEVKKMFPKVYKEIDTVKV